MLSCLPGSLTDLGLLLDGCFLTHVCLVMWQDTMSYTDFMDALKTASE